MTEEKFWKIVDKLGWGTKSVYYEKLGMELLQYVSIKDEILDMKTMAQDYRLALCPVIEIFMDSEKMFSDFKVASMDTGPDEGQMIILDNQKIKKIDGLKIKKFKEL